VSDVIHIFSAGSDTTTSTLRWAALFMAQHPHVQAKIHQEIDSVLGEKYIPNNFFAAIPVYTPHYYSQQRGGGSCHHR